jgi:hypothetical protein
MATAPKYKKPAPVNLLPQNEFEKSLSGRILKWILTTFRAIVITVELVVIVGFLARFWLDIQHSDLNDEITQKQALIESYLPFEKEFKLTQKKLTIFSSITTGSTQNLPLLTKVIKHLPSDASLVSFSRKPDQIEINGLSLTEQSIAQFITNLKTESEFSNITISLLENPEEFSFINFRLIVTTNQT